jgi:hypothetical protein
MIADQANRMLSEMTRVNTPPPAEGNASLTPVLEDQIHTDTASAPQASEAAVIPDKRPMAFVSGKIMGVDCSAEPGAVLTMAAAGKTYHLHVTDRNKLVLINADKFSCEWKGVKAAANYRDSGNLQGDLISLELP